MDRIHKKVTGFDIFVYAVLTLFAALIVVPFYTAIVISVVSSAEYTRSTLLLWPKELRLENYVFLLGTGVVASGYQNSLYITFFGLVYALSITVMMAYGFSRKEFPGKKIIFVFMLITMFFGGGLVPFYLLIRNLGLINTRASVILMMGVSPFSVIIIKSNFEQLPDSLEEAAIIDGANDLTVFFRIMLPLQKPIIATFALFISVGYWNEWFWSMILINDTRLFPLQVVLRSIVSSARMDSAMQQSTYARQIFSDGIKIAAVVLTMLPIMVIYPFLQRYFVKGVLVGAIKI